jgi:very-short-patch-repair endonuclease
LAGGGLGRGAERSAKAPSDGGSNACPWPPKTGAMDTSLDRRRELRRNSTDAEIALWSHLRAHRFAGFKFRRQHSCGPFILDFFCPKRRLAIELDGGQHFEPTAQSYDLRRTRYLASRGITVLRFGNDVVFRETEGVLLAIAAALEVYGPSP